MLALAAIVFSLCMTAHTAPTPLDVEEMSSAEPGFVEFITAQRTSELPGIIARFNAAKRGLIILDPSVPGAALPARIGEGVRVLDLRYNNGVHLVRGNHARLEGVWPQYGGLGTGLGKNLIVSDVITNDTPIESWNGKPSRHADTNFTDEKDYPNSHNHYQNFLSEVWNFSDRVNGVAIWGDSSALVPGAHVWGGFLSARSWPLHDAAFVSPGTPGFKDENFDAALIGLEIDVLNSGLKDGVRSPVTGKLLSKVGLQTVGFGKRNTVAIELRCVDTDARKVQADRDGVWSYGIISNNAVAADGTFIKFGQDIAGVGLDLSGVDCSRGAALFKTKGPGTGIVFNRFEGGDHGEIVVDTTAPVARTVVRAAPGGLVVLSNDGTRELLSVLPDGRLVSDGRLVRTERPSLGPKTLLWILGGVSAVFALGYMQLLGKIKSLKSAA